VVEQEAFINYYLPNTNKTLSYEPHGESRKVFIYVNAIPPLDEAITTIVVSLDGAYVLMGEDGYREAIVGNISLYDFAGNRQHTIYIGEAPEYGKGSFFQHLEKEIAPVKKHYPDALYLGIADGAKNNWSF